jgi:uncharacterized membrane protein
MSQSEKRSRRKRIFESIDRIGAFSDGVFAVAITLLVLSIAVPALKGNATNADLWHSLSSVWSHFLAYALSFLIIGAFWYRHHDLFDYMERADPLLIWLNLVFLMIIAFIPYATSLLGRYGDLSLGVAVYDATMVVTAILTLSMCLYATRGRRLVGKGFDYEFTYEFTVRYVSMILVFIISIVIAIFNPSAGMYFLVVLMITSPILDRLRPFHDTFIKWISVEKGEQAAAA